MEPLSDIAQRLLMLAPPHVRAMYQSPASLYEGLHGVVAGDACVCGEPLQVEEYFDHCRACGRPWRRRCAGIPGSWNTAPQRCSAWIEPELRGDRWHGPERTCPDCLRGQAGAEREKLVRRILPEREYRLCTEDWIEPTPGSGYEDRVEPYRRLRRWLKALIEGTGRSCAVLYGAPGPGKTVLMARALRAAVLTGHAKTAMWTSWFTLLEHGRHYYDADGRSKSELDRAARVDLLAVDDLFKHREKRCVDKQTGDILHSAQVVGEVFGKRFDAGRWTLATTNYEDVDELWQLCHDDPGLNDRWQGAGELILYTGESKRGTA